MDKDSNPKLYTPEEWSNLAKELYDLILVDVEKATEGDLSIIYPKLVIMYEFFRLIRGEAFNYSRPDMFDFQKDIYRMEDDISKKITELARNLDQNDDRVRFYLDETKKSFDLGYFKKQ